MKIVIVGYGWLGQQLAPQLAADGHSVFVTRRSAKDLLDLPPGLQGQVLHLSPTLITSAELLQVFHAALVICAIAPGQQQTMQYTAALERLAGLMHQAGSAGVLHFSSSGIYDGLQHDVDENAQLHLQRPRVQRLFAAEQAVQQFPRCITLRLAGLMGPGRHPGKFADGKTLPNPDTPVNMVHAFDVIAAVQCLLAQTEFTPALYNLSCPQRISRRTFYHQAALLAKSNITFSADPQTGRWVSPQYFIRQCGFHYRFAAATDALAYCD